MNACRASRRRRQVFVGNSAISRPSSAPRPPSTRQPAQPRRARPGAREVRGRLRNEGLRRAFVSNFDRRLPAILAGLGLGGLIEAIVLPSDAGASKPDPRIFQHGLDRLGIRAEEAIYVGDDALRDIEGARAAGLQAVAARSLATLTELRIPPGGA